MHYRLRVLKQEGIRTPFRRRSNFCRCVQGLFRYRFQLFFSKHSKFSTRIPKHLNKWIRPPDRILNKLCFNRHLILCDDYKAKIYCFWKFNYWVCLSFYRLCTLSWAIILPRTKRKTVSCHCASARMMKHFAALLLGKVWYFRLDNVRRATQEVSLF